MFKWLKNIFSGNNVKTLSVETYEDLMKLENINPTTIVVVSGERNQPYFYRGDVSDTKTSIVVSTKLVDNAWVNFTGIYDWCLVRQSFYKRGKNKTQQEFKNLNNNEGWFLAASDTPPFRPKPNKISGLYLISGNPAEEPNIWSQIPEETNLENCIFGGQIVKTHPENTPLNWIKL